MADINLDDEKGFVTVSILGTEKQLDLWQVSNQLFHINQEHQDRPGAEWLAALVEYLCSLGYPTCSQQTADRFQQAIFNRVADLKKELRAGAGGGEKADSPASTGQAS